MCGRYTDGLGWDDLRLKAVSRRARPTRFK